MDSQNIISCHKSYAGRLLYDNSFSPTHLLVDGGYVELTGNYNNPADAYRFYVQDHQGNNRMAKVYPSVVSLQSSKKIFNVDDEGVQRYHAPITINATFSKIGSKCIQGTFTADHGVYDLVEGDQQGVVLRKGVFSLSYSSGYVSGDCLEWWLREIEFSKMNWY